MLSATNVVMAVDYVRESAQELLKKLILVVVAVAALVSWAGSAALLVGLVGWAIKLGNEATIRKP